MPHDGKRDGRTDRLFESFCPANWRGPNTRDRNDASTGSADASGICLIYENANTMYRYMQANDQVSRKERQRNNRAKRGARRRQRERDRYTGSSMFRNEQVSASCRDADRLPRRAVNAGAIRICLCRAKYTTRRCASRVTAFRARPGIPAESPKARER